MPDVSGALSTAINAYDTNLNQKAILEKLGDEGLYIGEDGLLHVLRDRVIEGGMNIQVFYFQTTIVDGLVTSYVQARVENGIIYPPLEAEESDEKEE